MGREVWICPDCGWLSREHLPVECPVCNAVTVPVDEEVLDELEEDAWDVFVVT